MMGGFEFQATLIEMLKDWMVPIAMGLVLLAFYYRSRREP